jgi:DNA-directed RNA polymerase specialized sigma24 family protein
LEDPSNAARASIVAFDSRKDDAERKKRQETMLLCLERCLDDIRSDDRKLIFNFYQGEQRTRIENRRSLADQLGLTSNALNIRACRIRSKLERCVRQCCKGTEL